MQNPNAGRAFSPRSATLGPNSKRHKQVARIIKHLRPELGEQHPALAQPTGWMVDCLVHNCPISLLLVTSDAASLDSDDPADWQGVVSRALIYIADTVVDPANPFVQLNGKPLFPNHELFDERDAQLFCQSLADYLQPLMQS